MPIVQADALRGFITDIFAASGRETSHGVKGAMQYPQNSCPPG